MLVRTVGVEPTSSGWKPEALATKTKPALLVRIARVELASSEWHSEALPPIPDPR